MLPNVTHESDTWTRTTLKSVASVNSVTVNVKEKYVD